jgi:8-oxo-dGTP diphosphatase
MADDERRWIRVVSAEIQRDGNYLITQRPPAAVLPDLWEFPGGRVRDGESDQTALARCLRVRIGATATVGEKVLELAHEYEHYSMVLVVYRCEIDREPIPLKVCACEWVPFDDLGLYEFPGADERTVQALLSDDR